MSYFFRQRRLQQAEVVQKDALNATMNSLADKMVALASRMWREEDHPRGKTSPSSTPGSFAPRDAEGQRDPSTGRKWTSEAKEELHLIQQDAYRKLHFGELRSKDDLEGYAQRAMRDWMGPGYERRVSDMVSTLWAEYRKNVGSKYFDPRSDWIDRAWMKCDVQL